MYRIRKNKSHIIIALGAITLASCGIPKYATLPEERKMPARFTASHADSSQFQVMARDKFFTDPKLVHIINEVIRNNPDLNIAIQRVRTAGAYLAMSKGALLPEVNARVSASGTHFGKHTMEGVGNFDTNLSPNISEDQKINTSFTPDYWLGIGASWEIDLWGKLKNMKKAAQQRFIASEQGKHLLESALVTQTALLYYDLVALDREAEIIEQNIGLQQKALEIVEAQKAGGRATELAVQQFNAQLFNTRSAAFVIKQKITESENQLRVLAGDYEGSIDRSNLLWNEKFEQLAQTGVPAQLLENRPDLLQAQAELLAAKADLKAARAAFFPSLNISAYTAFNAFSGSFLFSGSSLAYQVLGGLTAPVFQKRQLKSQFNIADAQQHEAFYHFQKTALNAYREVNNLLQSIDNNGKIFRLKEQEVRALEQGVNISNDLYVTGYASYLEIISAQKNKLNAELELIGTRLNQISSVIGLYKATGGGWQ
jgi:multidrug efflux system outer membrane protein